MHFGGDSPFDAFREHEVAPRVSRLAHRLRCVAGGQSAFARLHADLLQVEADPDGSAQEVLRTHEVLRAAGAFDEPGHFGRWVLEYLEARAGGEAPAEAVEALGELDVQLFAHWGVLLEDLAPAVVERWASDPQALIGGSSLGAVKAELYGYSRFAVLLPEVREAVAAAAGAPLPAACELRRQLAVERETMRYSLREYLEDQEAAEAAGRGAGSKQRVWTRWVEVMAARIHELRDGTWKPKGRGSAWARVLRDDVALEPELVAVITCSTVLNQLLAPSWRRKSHSQAALNEAQVPYVTAVVAVGNAVALESSWRTLRPGETAKQVSPKALAAVRHLSKQRALTGDEELTVPLGGALVDLMLEAARVEVNLSKLPGHDQDACMADPAVVLSDDKRVATAPAIKHLLVREGIKTKGYLRMPSYVHSTVSNSAQGLASFISAKHQPMLCEPRPWLPSAVGRPQGGYLMSSIPFVRTPNFKMTCMRLYSPDLVARTMDGCGKTPWRVNGWILDVMEKAKELDLAIAELPPRMDPDIPPLPSPSEGLSEGEAKQRRIRHNLAFKRVRELQSERPTFDLKLRVAQDFRHAPRLYFPHNVDFRGRAYPAPPHLNHIMDDICRGLLMFADAKPLGKDGFDWMKVHMANLMGKNKIPFSERIAVVEEVKDKIIAAARDPLAEESIEFWTKCDDGPWQALAVCRELAAIWESDDVEGFLSNIPVHLDGSCNGLQHYAALGRDELGGRAVNVSPSERPQDVYSIVLSIVKEKVAQEAQKPLPEPEDAALPLEEGEAPPRRKMSKPEMARKLIELDVLQRKVVKQTVMTICYGVTTLGAKEQVRGQLEDLVGDRVEDAELRQQATYLSGLVLRSIDEVFDRAMKIKRWFDAASRVLSRLECPTSWISPIGLACVQPYKKQRKVKVHTKLQSVTLSDDHLRDVHKAKQRMGFPPNFVHSLDATHMMLVADRCRQEGILFAGVHDSFWTHAGTTTRLTPIIRDAFVELHGRPLLDELNKDLSLQIAATGLVLPPLPTQGDLKIEVVRDSPYFFH